MMRNLAVSGLVSVLMGLFVVAYTSLVPQAARTPMAVGGGAEQPGEMAGTSDEQQALVLFRQVVRPLLVRSCLKCHNADRREGGLDLSRRAAALRGGDTGEAIVPGKPDESLLVQLIEAGEMPKGGPMVRPEVLAAVRRWVELGAPYEGEPLQYRSEAASIASDRMGNVTGFAGAAAGMGSGLVGSTGTSMAGAVGMMAGAMAGMGGGANQMMMCPCMRMMMAGTIGTGMGGGKMESSVGGDGQPQVQVNPRTVEQARQRAEAYLRRLANPNLTIGQVRETIGTFEVEVVTKDGSRVNWLIIDKYSGTVRLAYGQ